MDIFDQICGISMVKHGEAAKMCGKKNIPSGNLTTNYGKSPLFMVKCLINGD